MEIGQIIMSALFIFLVFMIGLCARYAFKKGKNVSSHTDNNEKVVMKKKTVPDIENLDLRNFFINKRKN